MFALRQKVKSSEVTYYLNHYPDASVGMSQSYADSNFESTHARCYDLVGPLSTNKIIMKSYFAYIRVSTARQGEEDHLDFSSPWIFTTVKRVFVTTSPFATTFWKSWWMSFRCKNNRRRLFSVATGTSIPKRRALVDGFR